MYLEKAQDLCQQKDDEALRLMTANQSMLESLNSKSRENMLLRLENQEYWVQLCDLRPDFLESGSLTPNMDERKNIGHWF